MSTVRDDLVKLYEAQATGANIDPFGPAGTRDSNTFPTGRQAASRIIRRKITEYATGMTAAVDAVLVGGFVRVQSRLMAITMISPIAVVQSDTNYQTVTFTAVNPDTTTTTLASFNTKVTGGSPLTALTPFPVTLTVAVGTLIPAGAVIEFSSTHTGTGVSFAGAVTVVTLDEVGDETV